MTAQQPYQVFQGRQKPLFIVTASLLALIFVNVSLDYWFTLFRRNSFYLSESLLFSSYWVLYLPFLLFFAKPVRGTKSLMAKLSFTAAVIAMHLIAYPALVWLLSKIFYYHTFAYWQTFSFGLYAYFIKSVIIYVFAFVVAGGFNRRAVPVQADEIERAIDKTDSFDSILVTDSNNQKLVLATTDIIYFSANPPYVNVHHVSKRYLLKETLKSFESRLDENQFVRIHKSHIVHLSKIVSVQSRKNGDYDITLSNDTILRMSRNYVKNFKLKFMRQHQLTAD